MLRFAINLIYPLNFELLSERLFEYHHINQYQLDLLKVSPPLPSLVTNQLTSSILRSAAFWFPKQTQAQDNNNDPTYIFQDRKSTRLNSSHVRISYAVFCLKKKK